MYGFAGKMLFVNLTDKSIEKRELSEKLARDFLGGPALGAKILYDEMPAHIDPFSEESMLGFLAGPLNGTGALFGGRYTVVSKSPVTGMWNDANSGGYFGPDLKKAGFDAVFVKGISKDPVYIWIDNGEAEIRDASKLWGLTTMQTESAVKAEIGDEKINMALIGPGGENMSYMAAIMNDGHRAAARGGTGSVMGSKKLKAVVVRGNNKIDVADRDALIKENKAITTLMRSPGMDEACEGFGLTGTAGTFSALAMANDAGIKNWSAVADEEYSEEAGLRVTTAEIDGELKLERYGCSFCPMRCGAMYRSTDDRWPLEHTGRPEYETVGAFASMTLVDDRGAVLKCNDLCNEYGLDTISVGGTVAWVMECYHNGLLKASDLDGLEADWGNGEAMVNLVEKMGKGEGCGKIIGLGSAKASEHLGLGSEYLVTAGGIEPPQHDSRLAPGLTRTYQYDPTPGRHVKGTSSVGIAGEVPEVKHNYQGTGFDDLVQVVGAEIDNAAGWCYFARLFGIITDVNRPAILNAVTGFNYSRMDMHAMGQRMYTIRHAFNLREGLKREDCHIAERLVKEGNRKNGPHKGINVDHELLANNFFDALGWDREMKPSKFALEIVGGLDNVTNDLYPEG